MATTKVTFTLDAKAVRLIEQLAEQLEKPKSQVVRDAVAEYHERHGKLSLEERLALVKRYDELMARIPKITQAEADAELREIRRARRQGGRPTRAE